MSWSTGSQLFEEIANVLRANVSDYQARIDIYRELIGVFEGYDAELSDSFNSVDEAFDEAWKELYSVDEDEE